MNVDEWFQKLGWREDPFTLQIYPDILIGYEDQVKAIKNHINEHHKVALVTGPTGSGKTTMLMWLERSVPDGYRAFYISKPPQKQEDFVDILTRILRPSILERLLGRKPSIYTLADYVNKKVGKGRLILLLDESHESSRDVLEWIRVLTDQINNSSLVLAGLPAMESKLKELETLDQRIITRVRLTALSEAETHELIKRRIEHVGGSGTTPFTEDAIRRVYQVTGGFPREVLKICDRLLNDAIEKGSDTIDAKALEEHRELPKDERVAVPIVTHTPAPPVLADLPYKQRKILELLSKKDWINPTTIVDELESKAYKSKAHAIRSINNILQRMMHQGLVQRESRGKTFVYTLAPKVKTIFVEA